MIRIRTILDIGQVFTILWHGKWITITSYKDVSKKTKSIDAPDLLGAGENHLRSVNTLCISEAIAKKEAEAFINLSLSTE